MRTGPRRSNQRQTRWIWGLLVIAFCVVGTLNGIFDVTNELALQDRGQTIDATVTDAAIKSRYIVFLAYRIQYRFQVGDRRFWHDGSVLRNLYSLIGKQDRQPSQYWADTIKEDWEHSSRSKRVKVLYLPDDPWINRPFAASDQAISPLVGTILQTGLLVLLLAVGVSIVMSAVG